jgi:quinol monooxygenase YgiN
MPEQITVVASFTPKPGQQQAVERILRGMTAPSRHEPGCLRYDLYRNAGNAVSFTLFEIYTDDEAFTSHRETPHYLAYRAAIQDLLSAPIQVELLRGLDVAR